ncbi:hypothetical protein NO1_0337 [Candidatus Termititenax aidoneus]|uniref:Uncharacterized protein n=1 Tax=Termititenax aidoneus TaxID=2218524 RepID=A0A388T8C6_TERA1|nr:hypothetical protein NO1_0337 [Candidatus Termititenax aidoneus]
MAGEMGKIIDIDNELTNIKLRNNIENLIVETVGNKEIVEKIWWRKKLKDATLWRVTVKTKDHHTYNINIKDESNHTANL